MAPDRVWGNKRLKMIVLLDTNALLIPHQHRVDLFSEIERIVTEKHEVATLSTVVDELRGLASSTTKDDGAAARVGLRLLQEKKVSIIPSECPVDDAIVLYASQHKAIVCTNDGELKKRLKAACLETLSMRGKNHLERK